MDKKRNEMINESATNSKDKCQVVQQKEDEKLKQKNSVQPENKEVVSFIQASKGKRKFQYISDETSNNNQSGNPSSVLLGSNLSCGSNEVNVEKNASFKHCSENVKRGFIAETGLVREHNIASRTTGVITEQIKGKSNVSSWTHAASDEESVISSEEGTRLSFNEDTKNFLESEEVIKNAGFGSKNIFNFSRSFPKSIISPKNKETDTISGTNYKDGQISRRVASPVCCRNEETEVNTHTRDSATAEDAGPSGTMPCTHEEGNKNRFSCNLCGKEFAESWEFDAHYRTHRDEKAFVCDICQSKFPQKVLLKRHYRTHTGDKPFVCDVCSRGFAQKRDLVRHYRIHTGEKPYVCDICKWGFTQKIDLDRHSITHTGKKPYVCEVCQKGFALQKTLKIHYRIHTGEKPYVCDVCQKGFALEKTLKNHYRIHTGEKPYVCDICKRGFTRKRNLERHSRSHTGEKPYVCDVCNEGFADKGHLKNHYKTHTVEKPVVCDICKKDFADQSNLAKHIRIHTGEKPYKCTLCGKTYSDSSSCRKHYKEKHK